MEQYKNKILIAAVILLAAGGLAYWYKCKTEVPPTVELTKEQVEQPAIVQQESEKAGIKIDYGQAKEISNDITSGKTEKKSTVTATPTTYKKAAASDTKQNKADYNIIVGSDKVTKDTKTVEVQNYEIHAYKKIIRQVEYTPANKTVGFTINKKITDDGQYIGVGINHSFDDNTNYVKVVYSW